MLCLFFFFDNMRFKAQLRPCPPPRKVFFFLQVLYVIHVPFYSLPQAWLTEIHEYAQKDVVVMLLGNKARHRGKCFSSSASNNVAHRDEFFDES